MLGKLLVVGVLVVGAFVLSQGLMRSSFSYTLGALAALMLFGLVLLRNDFGIYVVTFSMLLSPEFTASGGGMAEGRTIMVRSEDFILIECEGRVGGGGASDERSSYWRRDGKLLATSEQLAWYREPGNGRPRGLPHVGATD